MSTTPLLVFALKFFCHSSGGLGGFIDSYIADILEIPMIIGLD